MCQNCWGRKSLIATVQGFLAEAQRASYTYQAAIWRRCLINNPEIPSITLGTWLETWWPCYLGVWFTCTKCYFRPLSCNCNKKCIAPKCVCIANNVNTCTDMWKLKTCTNQKDDEEEDDVKNLYFEVHLNGSYEEQLYD